MAHGATLSFLYCHLPCWGEPLIRLLVLLFASVAGMSSAVADVLARMSGHSIRASFTVTGTVSILEVGERTATVSTRLDVYISTQRRAFLRAAVDAVDTGGPRAFWNRFENIRGPLPVGTMVSDGARGIRDGGFAVAGSTFGFVRRFREGFELVSITIVGTPPAASCSVRVVRRPDLPGGRILIVTPISGRVGELRRMMLDAATCRIESGNVFGGPP